MVQDKLNESRSIWADMLAQTGTDGNYRNRDYQNNVGRHNVDEWSASWMEDDAATISKLIALYGITKDDRANANPFRKSFEGLSQDEADMRCRNISDGIVNFFNDAKSLASADRVQTRLAQAEPGTAKYVQVTDDFTARADEYAYQSLHSLADILMENHAFDAVNETVKSRLSPEDYNMASVTGNRMLFGNFYSKSLMKEGKDPVTGAVTTEPVRNNSMAAMGGDGFRGIAYDMMVGIANTIEQYSAEDLRNELIAGRDRSTWKGIPDAGKRMLFMENPGDEFLQAAEELNAGKRDRIVPTGRSDAATFEDMMSGMPAAQPSDAATLEDMAPKKEAGKEETPEEKFERLAEHAEKAGAAVQPAVLADKDGHERYRNSDYGSYALTGEDLELAGKLVALYAKTTTDMGPVLQDEEDMERRKNIGDAIGRFFSECGELAGEERVQERLVATNNGWLAVEDDFSARKERQACRSIASLSNALMANAFLRYMDPEAESKMTFEQIEYASDMNRSTFLGRYHAAEGASAQDEVSAELPYKDENGNDAKYQVVKPKHKETLDFVKYFQDAGNSSYALMVAMAKSIEGAGADGLKQELNSSATRGAATRMLFKAETDKSFEAAANELAEKSRQNGVIVNDFR